ncbi:lysophospholipid acyltransferase family protein [Candidatus Nitronereus thalassa]|uniref:Lysophospholipid acyltransferase family protein n=1 Tax=Candidatus Nitronereus thalassa TaxID=3020898 RepID=A0ABU3K5Y5_9BACT|nr:lysophospholipid acyltransferase family protein [Candidatus Nitronereus thalassa]MDT7041815.1 lysophospholipid acyltransferase family protein [Candidatus Nitronereus thalassa]
MDVNPWITKTVIPRVGYWLIRGLGKTMRWSVKGSEFVDQLYGEGKRVIIAFWHGQQLMMPLAYRGNVAQILISQHRDGELICGIMKQFGFGAVRGSTTRGGSVALRQLIRLGKSGADLVVTPDGPKGPRHVVQKGVIQLAQATGLPIVPLTFACSKKKSFRVGINSCCLFLFPEGVLFGERLSG